MSEPSKTPLLIRKAPKATPCARGGNQRFGVPPGWRTRLIVSLGENLEKEGRKDEASGKRREVRTPPLQLLSGAAGKELVETLDGQIRLFAGNGKRRRDGKNVFV